MISTQRKRRSFMSSPVGALAANTVLAMVDDSSLVSEPQLTPQQIDEIRREEAGRELERQKLCKQLLAEKPSGTLDSLVRRARLWTNGCSESTTTPQEAAPATKEAAKPVPHTTYPKSNETAKSQYHWTSIQ